MFTESTFKTCFGDTLLHSNGKSHSICYRLHKTCFSYEEISLFEMSVSS